MAVRCVNPRCRLNLDDQPAWNRKRVGPEVARRHGLEVGDHLCKSCSAGLRLRGKFPTPYKLRRSRHRLERMVAEGYSNRRIARELGVGVSGVGKALRRWGIERPADPS